MKKIETEYLIPFIFEKNTTNTKVSDGIENLFDQELFTDDFYSAKDILGKSGAYNIIREFQKNDFAEHVCDKRNSEDDFNNFKPLFEYIQKNLLIVD